VAKLVPKRSGLTRRATALLLGPFGVCLSGATAFAQAPVTETTLTAASAGLGGVCVAIAGGAISCGQLPSTIAPILLGTFAGLFPTVLQVSAGDTVVCALLTGNAVVCGGGDTAGLRGQPAGAAINGIQYAQAFNGSFSVQPVFLGALQVAAGADHVCALKPDGGVWCWGTNVNGELGTGAFSTGGPAPVQVSALPSATQIAAGTDDTCAVTRDGAIWCWGQNGFGKLGDGTMNNSPTPLQVTPLGTNVRQVTTGSGHTCALKTDGTTWCWGWNSNGQLGSATATDSSLLPVQVTALGSGVAQISAGWLHTCALGTDGSVSCWGANNHGQLGNGSATDSASPVAVVGLGHAVVQITAGANESCATRSDGTLWCWGEALAPNSTSSTPLQVTASITLPTPAPLVPASDLGTVTLLAAVLATAGLTALRRTRRRSD
jgi:hypothetical protein